MSTRILASLLCLFPVFFVFAAQTDIPWTSEDYQVLYGDFDGDGKPDSVIVAKSPSLTTVLFSDDTETPVVSHHPVSYDPQTEHLVAGDFDNDGMAEILVLTQDLTGYYWDYADGAGFTEGEQKLKIKGYNENRRIDFTHLYRGDFNGDGSDDLLAYAEHNHDIVVFHNRNSDKKVKFRFDSQLNLDNSSRLSPLIADFSGDGQQDIALFSAQTGGKSYVAFAGKKGKFKKADFEDITPYLGGDDWSMGQHAIVNRVNPATEESGILRLANIPGGIDEEGNVHTNDDFVLGLRDTIPTEPQDAGCQDLVYSPLHQSVETICADEEAKRNTGPQSGQALSLVPGNQQSQSATLIGAGEARLAHSSDPLSRDLLWRPQNYPEVSGGHYHPVGSHITIDMYESGLRYDAERAIESYRLYMGSSVSHTPKVYDGPDSRAVNIPVGDNYGFRYIRFQRCNRNGCSSMSRWRRIQIYQAPGGVRNLTSHVSSTARNQNVVIRFERAGGLVSGGFNYLYEKAPGSPEKLVHTIPAGTGSSVFNYSATVTPLIPGVHTYRAQACNPQNVGCGSNRWVNVTVTNKLPVIKKHSLSASEQQGASINVLSGASDPEGDGLSLFSHSQGSQGSVSCSGSTCTYTSQNLSQNITDSFTYVVSDEYGAKSTAATVTVNVANLSEGTVATPVMSPAGGSYVGSRSVSISTTTPGATIYYTTNGSNPTTSSTRYTGSFTLTGSATVKAIAVASDYSNSSVRSQSFTITPPVAKTPTISPAGGNFTGSTTVSISTTTPAASIYYTTNGSNPTTSSTRYTGPFTLSDTTTIKAITTASGFTSSGITTLTYTRVPPPRRIVYIHTDALGSPASQTDENGNSNE